MFIKGNWTGHNKPCLGCIPSGINGENGEAEENVDRTVVDTLHQEYLNSSLYCNMRDMLEKVELSLGNKKRKLRQVNQITYANGFFTQLCWVSKRSLKNLIRNPQASVAQVRNWN